MNILLIGGTSSLINHLILKLRKEGHRVFLLTGSKYKKNKYEKVFERYDFPYEGDYLREIFDSVSPDITVFMGAFDSNYRWQEEGREAVRFASNLMNMLVACSEIKKGRVIFLSSDAVFEGDYEEAICEDETPSGKTFRGTTLAQAEQICANVRKNWEMDVTVLRLAHLYHIPKSLEDADNLPAGMCIEALRDGAVRADESHEFSLLHENDAVEYIYRAIHKQEHQYDIYHLSSANAVSEVKLAGLIRQSLNQNIGISGFSGVGGCHILDGSRFAAEYGVQEFCSPEKYIQQMVVYMQKHKAVFLENKKEKTPFFERVLKKWGWAVGALVPFIENLICFIPFFMLNNRTAESQYFANLDFYLLYVLLFAVIYGQQQASFSAVCAVAGYIFRQMYHRSGFEVVLDYNTYVWIAQLFIVGLIVGYLRDQIRAMKMESKEMEEYLSGQIQDIKDINSTNVRVKEVMEQQLIDQKDSIGKIYSITSELDRTMPDEVLFDAVEMMERLMGTEDVAIYNVANGDYARMFSASSKKARELGNSIRYKEMSVMYDALKEHRVFINKSLDPQYPLMANAIFENEEMQMIVMLWGLSWERMTLGQANMLVVVSALIQNAVLSARRYLQALEEKRYIEGSRILDQEAFSSLVTAYYHAKERNLVECVLLHLQLPENTYKTQGDKVSCLVRNSDYLGILDGGLYILLTNTDRTEADFVKRRLQEHDVQSEIMEYMPV